LSHIGSLYEVMDDENMHYPLHLGVTEAGNELDGRIKSAVGIGALLWTVLETQSEFHLQNRQKMKSL